MCIALLHGIEKVWEVTKLDTIMLRMTLMLKLNLPYLIFMGDMMLRNT
jgi:hypothetical protein